MFRYCRFLLLSLLPCVLGSSLLHGQAGASGPRNLLANPSFENSFRRENPWDGVNNAGFLEGQRMALPVLTRAGTVGDTSMPVSVAVADLNGNGLNDIIMADVVGYFRVYFNRGTPQEPKFDHAELLPVFTSNIREPSDEDYRYRGPRISVAELGANRPELVIGNYIGEIMLLRNTGTRTQPAFRQPANVTQMIIPTSPDNRRWGNVFAPVMIDFTRNGRPDLLIGEGSYSANNIHLLVNEGTPASPRFTKENRYFLAFGDGNEQLTPAVVDFNGNGRLDLLVADGSGKIGLYLNNDPNWKPGDELPFVSYLSGGGREMAFGGIPTVAVGDLTGNGLFDLVVGKANGRIAVAFNKGTKEEPKFDPPQELKGEAVLPQLQLPSGWELDIGVTRGNFFAYSTVVDAEAEPNLAPPDGSRALKFGYFAPHNRIIPFANPPFFQGFRPPAEARVANWTTRNRNPANYFIMRQDGRIRFDVGKTYILSFRVKGNRVSNGVAQIRYSGQRQLGDQRIERGERGSARVIRNEAREEKVETFPVNAGPNWSEIRREFRVQFDDPDLGPLKQTTGASLNIGFELAPGAGEIYFDDFRLIEKS
jgi:hypothetical protein